MRGPPAQRAAQREALFTMKKSGTKLERKTIVGRPWHSLPALSNRLARTEEERSEERSEERRRRGVRRGGGEEEERRRRGVNRSLAFGPRTITRQAVVITGDRDMAMRG